VHLFKHDNLSLVSGMFWRSVLDTTAEKSERKTYAAELGASLMTRVEVDGDVCVGFLPDPRGEDGKAIVGKAARLPKMTYSIAALFAQMPDLPSDALLFYKLSAVDYEESAEDNYFVVGVGKGLPMAGFDLHGSFEAAHQAAHDFVSITKEGVAVFSNVPEAFSNAKPIELSELLDNRSALKQALLAPVKQSPIFLIGIVFGLLILVAGGWFAYDQYDRAEKARLAEIKRKQDPNLLYAKALPDAMTKAGVLAKTAVPILYERVRALPIMQGGWRFTKAICQGAALTCSTDWEPANGMATYKSFQDAFPDWHVTLSPGLAAIKGTLSIETKDRPVTGLDSDKLPDAQEFLAQVGSMFQERKNAGWIYTLADPQIYGAPPGANAAAIVRPVKSGSWRITGPAWSIDGFESFPDNMTADSLRLNIESGSPNITVEGKYYVREKNL
jgi:hypothetical protein